MNSTTRTVTVGGFGKVRAAAIGGDSQVVIQTMWKDRLFLSDSEAEKIIARIGLLSQMGCGLLRFAVPDLAAAEAVGRLAESVSMPLVADIHFDYKIALRCMDFPIAKIRINPGNIGSKEKIRQVLEKAAANGIPIRIGVNAGSLPKDIADDVAKGKDCGEALAEAAFRELAVFDEFSFGNILVSIKASGIADTIKANRIIAERTDVPLHIGVTEAGPLVAGVARSSAAMSLLLAQGIGDTLRVSLSDSMENEMIAAREICKAAEEIARLSGNQAAASRLRQGGVTVVSCPRCGRHGFDTHGFCERWLPKLYAMQKKLTVAVMGCEVNGPGEARHADIGITGVGNKTLIFRHGVVVRTVPSAETDKAFLEELDMVH